MTWTIYKMNIIAGWNDMKGHRLIILSVFDKNTITAWEH